MLLTLTGGLVDGRGVLALAVLAAACHGANHGGSRTLRALAHVSVWTLTAGLFLHLVPGFNNPLMLDRVVLGAGAMPYTQYLNLDKGIGGLLLLGLYVPGRLRHDQGRQHVAGFLWRFVVVVAVVIALSLALGYVRWDPKLPPWFPLWAAIMLGLTAMPEEAAFRGVVHAWFAERWGDRLAIVAGGLAFGLAHLAGGPMYVVVASVAGIGYGWIFASTRSIVAAILAHAGLNTIHLLFFTYPALLPVR